jgi:hypothetical protein
MTRGKRKISNIYFSLIIKVSSATLLSKAFIAGEWLEIKNFISNEMDNNSKKKKKKKKHTL